MDIIVEYTKGRRDFQKVNLRSANLRGANLPDAYLRGANLPDAYLRSANLRNVDLRDANLRNADLWGANLPDANLRGANLQGANLQGANLRSANLRSADLRDANLQGADLRDANLRDADLRDANLRSANLRSANLQGVCLPPLSILPDGDIIGWKKLYGGKMAQLLIPAAALRVNSTGRKCRAEFAKVLDIIDSPEGAGRSIYNGDFVYRVGETVRPDRYDPDFRVECSHGIHFFITWQEAEDY